MSDATDRLMDAALQPLADSSEQRQAGLGLLDGMLKPDHPCAAAMLARWEVVDARKRRPWWRRALALALVVLSAWVLIDTAHEWMWYKGVSGWQGFGTVLVTPAEPREIICKGLSGRNRFLLFGDISKPTKSEQIRALWDSAPDNPAYFAEYAITYRGDHGEYPPDFLETARRLDPENAWFTYQAAADLAHNSVKKERQSAKSKKAGEAPSWQILDEAKLNQALALMREATRQRHFADRQKELLVWRVPMLPQDSQISRLASVSYVPSYLTSDFTMRYLIEAVAAKAWLLGEGGDAAEFRQLLGDADAFIVACGGRQNPTLIDVLLLKSNAALAVRNLHAAAGKLGLVAEADRLQRIKGKFELWSEDNKNREQSDQMALRSSFLTGSIDSVRNQVKSPPPLSDADLKPGRMAEHLMVARLGSLAVWVVLGLGLLAVAVFRFCLPPAVLRLAQRVNELLQPIDWIWLLVAGVLLPFGYVTALMRLTPLGGQDWGIHATGVTLPAADFLALALLLLVVPVWVARWRLSRRAAALGICNGSPLIGGLAVAAGLAFVPVIGLSAPLLIAECGLWRMDWNFENPSFIWRSVLLVPLLLLILASVVRALAAPFTRQFSRAVVALAVIPAYACGMLLVMLSLPVYQSAQAYWEHRDAMTEITANGGSRYESEVARQMLQEVREVLELDSRL